MSFSKYYHRRLVEQGQMPVPQQPQQQVNPKMVAQQIIQAIGQQHLKPYDNNPPAAVAILTELLAMMQQTLKARQAQAQHQQQQPQQQAQAQHQQQQPQAQQHPPQQQAQQQV
jgi:hypothetical protein